MVRVYVVFEAKNRCMLSEANDLSHQSFYLGLHFRKDIIYIGRLIFKWSSRSKDVHPSDP